MSRTFSFVLSNDLTKGYQAAFEAYNAAQPKTVEVDGVTVPNPALIDSLDAYVLFVNTGAAKSYCKSLLGIDADVVPHVPTTEEIIATGTAAVQYRLDSFAQEHGFDSMLSARACYNSSVPQFKADAERCQVLYDQTWAKCYSILDDVQTGKRPMPTLPELMGELPELTWE